MKYVHSSIAILVIHLLLQILGWDFLGVQPLLVFVLAFAFRMDTNLSALLLLSAGFLGEWFSAGSRGEILGAYLVIALIITWLQKRNRHALRSTSNLISILLVFAAVLTGAVFASVSSNPSPTLGVVVLWQFSQLFISNATVLVLLHLYNLKQANGQI